jgi:antitoxin (DNA-binding transcriptional repressor) of toxin-antitoxin stability system
MEAREYAGEHRGQRLVQRRSPRGDKTYRLPEQLAERPISESIRQLASEGWSRSEISNVTGILYQHVRNVLEGQVGGTDKVRSVVEPEALSSSVVEESQVGSKVAFAELIRRMEHGDDVIIARDGRKVAQIVPFEEAERMTAVRKAMAHMDEIRKRSPLRGLSIKDLINEGRR